MNEDLAWVFKTRGRVEQMSHGEEAYELHRTAQSQPPVEDAFDSRGDANRMCNMIMTFLQCLRRVRESLVI